MLTATARWGAFGTDPSASVVTGPDAAERLCRDIMADEESGSVIVGFEGERGQFFGIGLGADMSSVMYWETADPPYFQSRGGGGPVVFSYEGHHTEFPPGVYVDYETAFRALREFMQTGRIPSNVDWVET